MTSYEESVLTRRFFVIREAKKGNFDAAAVNKESKFLQIREDSKKKTDKVSNSRKF